MTKCKKIIFFFIISLFASLIATSDVFAGFYVGEGMGYEKYEDGDGQRLQIIKTKDSNGNYNKENEIYFIRRHWTYYPGYSDNELYCIDQYNPSGSTSTTLEVVDVLDPNEPHDAVILTILSKESTSTSNYNEYHRDIALRAYLSFSQLFKYPSSGETNLLSGVANSNSGIKWMSEMTNEAKVLLGLDDVSLNNLAKVYKDYMYEEYSDRILLDEDNSDVKLIKELFVAGVKKGASVAKARAKGKDAIVIKNTSVSSVPYFDTAKNEYKEENGEVYSYKEVNYAITFNNFNDGSTDPVNVETTIAGEGNHKVITTYAQYQKSDGSWTNFDSNTNFLPLISDSDSKTINFKFGVKTSISGSSNEQSSAFGDIASKYKRSKQDAWASTSGSSSDTFDLGIHIKVKYKDDPKLSGALIYNTNDTSKETQRFFAYDRDGDNTHRSDYFVLKWTINSCIYVAPDTSDTAALKDFMIKCCRGNNDEGFNIVTECENATKNGNKTLMDKYCGIKEKYCDICDGEISVPGTCSEFSEDGNTTQCSDNADAIAKDSDNVKLCILDYSDKADNSYKLTKDPVVANNPYCSVYCKEDYKISLPLGRWVESGKTFALALDVDATKTCYTDQIADINQLKQDLSQYYNDAAKYTKAVNQYRMCTEASWNSDINLDPKISMTYDETEYMKLFNQKIDFNPVKIVDVGNKDSNVVTSNDNVWKCAGDVDDYYNTCTNSSINKVLVEGFYDPSDRSKPLYVYNTKYAKKVSFASATYAPKNEIYTNVGTGTIAISSSEMNTKLLSDLGFNYTRVTNTNPIPVALSRKQGAYKFNIKFEGIGEFFGSNQTGRLIGAKNSVAAKSNINSFESEYLCHYTVKCPECKTECHDDPKKGYYCDDSKRIVTVIPKVNPNPIDAPYFDRQISVNNLNPNQRDLGFNWNNEKGQSAIDEIQEKGESIYNDEPAYSITLSPSDIKMLQDYNEKNSSYTSFDDIKCVLYSSTMDKNSEFYKDLVENDFQVCDSKLLEQLSNIKENNNNHSSWLESCDDSKYNCEVNAIYGPAYK